MLVNPQLPKPILLVPTPGGPGRNCPKSAPDKKEPFASSPGTPAVELSCMGAEGMGVTRDVSDGGGSDFTGEFERTVWAQVDRP